MKKRVNKKDKIEKIETNKNIDKEENIDIPKSIDLEDVLKSQISLYQFCHVLHAENSDLKLKMQKLSDQISMTEQSNQNLKRFLEVIAEKIQELKNRMMDDEPDPKAQDGDQSNQPSQSNRIMPNVSHPLHDDVTISCEVCNKVHHAKMKKCPNCGYDRAKKGR